MTEYTLFGRCRDLCAAERRHYLLREPAQLFQHDAALGHDAPGMLRIGKAGEPLGPEILDLEQGADLPPRRIGYDEAVRLRHRL
jgi:hypothetical protein